MKKIFYFMAAALALGSCQQDNIVMDEAASSQLAEGQYAITASIKPSSRIDINGFKTTWSADDAIAVFGEYGEKAECPLAAESAGQSIGTFMSSMEPTEIFYAAYPTNSSTVMNQDADSLIFNLPSEYAIGESSMNAPMFSAVSMEGDIAFQYITSMLKVKYAGLPEGYNTLKFWSKGSSIAGQFKLSVSAPEEGIMPYAHGTKEVKITHADNSGEYYLPLPAGKYSELHISVLNAEGKEIQLVTLYNKTFESSKMYNLVRDYKPIIEIPEPTDFILGHPSKDNYVDGWTKHASFDKNATLTMVENDPSFLWNNSIQIEHNNGDLWNHSISFNYDNTAGTLKPTMYKLSFKMTSSVKMGWKVANLVTATDPNGKQEDTFQIVIQPNKTQVWQSQNSTDGKCVERYIFVNLAENAIAGWGGTPTWRHTAGTDFMNYISLVFRNPGAGANCTTLISDVQLSEVIQ